MYTYRIDVESTDITDSTISFKPRAINAAGEAQSTARIRVTATTETTEATGIVEQQQYIEKIQMLEQQQANAKTQFNRFVLYQHINVSAFCSLLIFMYRSESMVEPTSPPEFKTPIKDQVNVLLVFFY